MSAAVKPEPVTVGSSKVDSLVENQLQLVVSKQGYGSCTADLYLHREFKPDSQFSLHSVSVIRLTCSPGLVSCECQLLSPGFSEALI